MALDFTYVAQPARVIFGKGRLTALPEAVEALDCKRALVLCTPGQREQAEQVAALLGAQSAGVYDQAVMHVPLEVARKAQAHAAGGRRGLRRRGGRRIDDRARQGDRAGIGYSHHRRADHLCGIGNDPRLWPDRSRREAHRQGHARAAAHRDLRS